MGSLEGKIALVTGGTSGIGLATAKRFVAEGAYVFITGRSQTSLDAAVAAIGSNVTGVQGDIANLADLDRLYAVIAAEKGRLDVVFANAGAGSFAPLGAITEEQYDDMFGANVKGTIFTVQKALPLLADGGSVILNASNVHEQGVPAFSIYAGTKAAIRSFARGWTTDLKDRKIRVNSISPGVVPTNGYRTNLGMSDEQISQLAQQIATQIPAQRVGTTDEIASAVTFLASDASSYITAFDLVVDGGQTLV